MAALLLIRFPDGSWEYHVPYRKLCEGDVVRARDGDWSVLSVSNTDEQTIVSVLPRPSGGSWPGPLDDVPLYAPAA